MKTDGAMAIAKKAGEEAMRKEKACSCHIPVSIGKKISRCRCGLIAKIDAPVWKQRQVKRSALSTLRMVAGNEKKYNTVIDNGELRTWVGIGWINDGTATKQDKGKFPIVID